MKKQKQKHLPSSTTQSDITRRFVDALRKYGKTIRYCDTNLHNYPSAQVNMNAPACGRQIGKTRTQMVYGNPKHPLLENENT